MKKDLDFVSKPWLARQKAAQAEAPGPVEERAQLMIQLSRLPRACQHVSISKAQNREGLVEYFMSQDEYGALITLLGSDLARWLPGAVEFSELEWLLGVLLDVKKSVKGKKAKVFLQTPAGLKLQESAAMLKALLDEAIYAAAGAWVRCLGGPGGEHRVWELPPVLKDSDLAEAVFSELAGDPRGLALLLEDVPHQLSSTGLTPEELLELLHRGTSAAQFCYDTIVQGIKKISDGS